MRNVEPEAEAAAEAEAEAESGIITDTCSSVSSSLLDHETLDFLTQLHYAWANRAHASAYERLRDQLLLQRVRVDARVAALSAVARIACPGRLHADTHWEELLSLATSIENSDRKRKRAYRETHRLRNYHVVAALWSPQLLLHYGWDKAGQTQMHALRMCATRYPRFTDNLCPRLNTLLLDRHCQGIKHGRLKTLNEAVIQFSHDLSLSALESAVPNDDAIHPWLNDDHGNFSLRPGDPWLSQLRPHHFRSYLLEKDRFGLLVARDQGFTQAAHSLQRSRATSQAWTPDLEDRRTPHFDVQDLPVGPPQAQNAALITHFDPYLTAFPGSSRLQSEHLTTWGDPQTLHYGWRGYEYESSPLRISEPSDLDDGLGTVAPHAIALDVDSAPLGAAQHCHTSSCGPVDHSPSGSSEIMPSESELDSHWDCDTDISDEPMETSVPLAPCRSTVVAARTKPTKARVVALARRRRKDGMLKPVRAGGQVNGEGCDRSNSPDLTIASPHVGTQYPLTLEQVLQERHRDLLKNYAAKLVKEARRANASPQRQLRAQWFTPATKWARVWTCPGGELHRGGAISPDKAEVLYYTSDQFITAAQNDQIFSKPIVIKETFTDSEMHTIHGLTSLLKDAQSGAMMEVQKLDDVQLASVPVDEFVADIQHNRLEGINALKLRNITKCHQPLFTMLSRFRLLKSLVDRVEGDTLSKRVVSPPVDVASCTSFNMLGFRGAFSGAHLDSLCGTWVRNLAGIKFWMIIPQEVMDSEWEIFVESGCDWGPNGKQRLVLLEQDDVLLLPPGLRVVHAVHSPTDCLMEGGMFWDERNILQILESICWICKNQATTNEAIAYQLPSVIGKLEELVKEQSDRFRCKDSKENFLRMFDEAVLNLKDLGCYCSQTDCDEWCMCRQQGRRCTAWCSDHPQISLLGCMHGDSGGAN